MIVWERKTISANKISNLGTIHKEMCWYIPLKQLHQKPPMNSHLKLWYINTEKILRFQFKFRTKKIFLDGGACVSFDQTKVFIDGWSGGPVSQTNLGSQIVGLLWLKQRDMQLIAGHGLISDKSITGKKCEVLCHQCFPFEEESIKSLTDLWITLRVKCLLSCHAHAQIMHHKLIVKVCNNSNICDNI